MIPFNNLSVLPFYGSLDEQNARKWWVYGKVFPLFAPALSLLPFQVMRETRTEWSYEPGDEMEYIDEGDGYIRANGTWESPSGVTSVQVREFETGDTARVYFENLPVAYSGIAVMAAAYDSSYELLETFNPIESGYFTGDWELPEDTAILRIQYSNTAAGTEVAAVYDTTPVSVPRKISVFKIYQKDGTLVGDYATQFKNAGLTVKALTGYDVIVWPGNILALATLPDGQYYIEMSDGVETWYSEIFTAVNDVSCLLKMEWWDVEDFIMDEGAIVYTSPAFKNILYLPTDVARPEYNFEDETEERDGYSFPLKQISKKVYHFTFLAPEYLLDVLRFVRMSDYVKIYYEDKTFVADSFLITPEWEDQGDIASVEAEFTTNTVAKKLGRAITSTSAGDFNDDFNDDFYN